MNSVQRNFKAQQRQIEAENKHRWRREEYYDHYQHKKFIRYYDINGELMKTEEKRSPTKIIVGILAGIFVIILIGVISTISHNIPNKAPTLSAPFQTQTTQQAITIENLQSIWENHILYITGSIHNISGKQLNSIHLDVTLEDGNCSKIGTVTADAKNMATTDIWNFKIPVNNATGVKHFDLDYTVK